MTDNNESDARRVPTLLLYHEVDDLTISTVVFPNGWLDKDEHIGELPTHETALMRGTVKLETYGAANEHDARNNHGAVLARIELEARERKQKTVKPDPLKDAKAKAMRVHYWCMLQSLGVRAAHYLPHNPLGIQFRELYGRYMDWVCDNVPDAFLDEVKALEDEGAFR